MYNLLQPLPISHYYSKEMLLRKSKDVTQCDKLPLCPPSYQKLIVNNASLLEFMSHFQKLKAACGKLYIKKHFLKSITFIM